MNNNENQKEKSYEDSVKESFKLLTDAEKHCVFLCSILCCERRIPQRILAEIVASNARRSFQDTIDGLFLGYWLDIQCGQVKVNVALAEVIYMLYMPDEDEVNGIIRNLQDGVSLLLHPFSPITETKPYFMASFSLLRYLYRHPISMVNWNMAARLAASITEFGGALTNDVTTIESPMFVEQHPLFQLLVSASEKAEMNSDALACVYIKIAYFYCHVFLYREADLYLGMAAEILKNSIDELAYADLLRVRSEVEYNKGLIAQGIVSLNQTFDIVERLYGNACPQNIENALRLSLLCCYGGRNISQAMWKKRAYRAMGRRTFPQMSVNNVLRLMADAATYSNFTDLPLIQGLLEEAEYIAMTHFGLYSVVGGEICALRSFMYDKLGLQNESIIDYNRYVDCIAYSFGHSTGGDVANLMATEVFRALNKGNSETAVRLCDMMMRRMSVEDSTVYPPGVRVYQYMCIAYTYWDVDRKLADEYASKGIAVVEHELMPSEELRNELSKALSKQEAVPGSLLGFDIMRMLYVIKIRIALAEDNFELAHALCREAMSKLASCSCESHLMAIELGRIAGTTGEYEKAEGIWDELLSAVSHDEYLKLASEIGNTAYEIGMNVQAKKYFDKTEII